MENLYSATARTNSVCNERSFHGLKTNSCMWVLAGLHLPVLLPCEGNSHFPTPSLSKMLRSSNFAVKAITNYQEGNRMYFYS